MQLAIQQLRDLGKLPRSSIATSTELEKYESLIAKITLPLDNEDALVLIGLLGPDDCFGLAWTIIHLVETAPDWPIDQRFEGLDAYWVGVLKERI